MNPWLFLTHCCNWMNQKQSLIPRPALIYNTDSWIAVLLSLCSVVVTHIMTRPPPPPHIPSLLRFHINGLELIWWQRGGVCSSSECIYREFFRRWSKDLSAESKWQCCSFEVSTLWSVPGYKWYPGQMKGPGTKCNHRVCGPVHQWMDSFGVRCLSLLLWCGLFH